MTSLNLSQVISPHREYTRKRNCFIQKNTVMHFTDDFVDFYLLAFRFYSLSYVTSSGKESGQVVQVVIRIACYQPLGFLFRIVVVEWFHLDQIIDIFVPDFPGVIQNNNTIVVGPGDDLS